MCTKNYKMSIYMGLLILLLGINLRPKFKGYIYKDAIQVSENEKPLI